MVNSLNISLKRPFSKFAQILNQIIYNCFKPDLDLKFNGIPRALDFLTDMPFNLWVSVYSEVNRAFDQSIGDFKKATSLTYSYLKQSCPGEWVVLVSGNGILNDKQHFCAAYERYSQTSFNATYDYSHNIQLFSPKCQPSNNEYLA